MQDYNITTESGRRNLDNRREPYWRRIDGTGYLGFRKHKVPSWIARWRGPRGKLKYRSLGKLSKTNDFKRASKKAREWFEQCEQGASTNLTVRQACEAYVNHQWAEKEVAYGHVFEMAVYDAPIAKLRLDELRPDDVEQWRNSLVTAKRAKNSVNRLLRSFKAAMNYAYKNGIVGTDRAWSVVKAFPVSDGQRKNFLTKAQIASMVATADKDFRPLLRASVITGARPGELTKARVEDLDVIRSVLRLSSNKNKHGKTRIRDFPLSAQALAFFREQTRGKTPRAWLFPAPDGRPWDRFECTRAMERIRKSSDTLPKDLCRYDLRHTAISHWLANGMDIATVAKIAGTSVHMIEKHYFKFIPTDVADRLAAISLV